MENVQSSRRRSIVSVSSQPSYVLHYKDVVEQNINPMHVGTILLSSSDLGCDMSLLKQMLQRKPLPCLVFQDFESAKFVDSILEEPFMEKCVLEDDGLRMSREYVDLTQLKNLELIVPLDYLVWGVKFNDRVSTYCFKFNDITPYAYLNGNSSLSLEDLKKIREAIHRLSHYRSKDAIDKMCLVSDYLQSRTQFIHGRESIGGGRCFITPGFPEHIEDRGFVETVLNYHHGVCMGIANLSTLLLNNPELDVEVESVDGSRHVWNKILIDGTYYYFDNTWCITRSDTSSKDGLITLEFSKKYLLFGSDTAEKIGSHKKESEFIYQNGLLSSTDYPNEIDYHSQFAYREKPKYYSYLKK